MAEVETPLTAREVATRAGLSIDTIKRALKTGLLRGHRVGARGDWRVEVADYRDWLAAGAPTPPAPRNKPAASEPKE